MDNTAALVWHSFLQSAPLELRDRLYGCIAADLLKEIQSVAPPSVNLCEGMPPIEEELSSIHYSWFTPFLRSLSESDIKLFLSCLTKEQIEGLKSALRLTENIPIPSPVGKEFLTTTLFNSIAKEGLLPIPCLPENPLNRILELSFSELNSLIQLLSMHDLSVEIRHIIETTKLKEIYGILTKAQSTFLKTLLHKKEVVSFKKMGLINWKGDRESLKTLLLQRGINRIAKALYPCHPDLAWHTAHRLDAENGSVLLHLRTALDHPRAAALLADQVMELVYSIKNNNPLQNL